LSTQAHVIKTRLPSPPPSLETLLGTVRDAVEELKARDVVEIDVRGKSSVTDYMVIASGTSTRHVKSIADEVVKFAKQKLDVMPLGVEGEREAEWVLVDLGDVVVHVMLPRVREFYALERLWTVGDEPPREQVDELASGTLGEDDDGYGEDEEPLSFEDDADEFDVGRRPRPSL
jgi:ribosome-associated protein